MNKTFKIYIGLLFLAIGFVVFINANAPKPLNWFPSYSITDKNPLGLYVLNNEMKTLFKNDSIVTVNQTVYQYLSNKFDQDSVKNNYTFKGTFLSISENSELDNESVNELCYFVSRGNCAFISAKNLNPILIDTLKFDINSSLNFKDTTFVWLNTKNKKPQKFTLNQGAGIDFFSKIDTINTQILGYQAKDSVKANFIKVKYYYGYFYLHLQPAVFSNYYLLKNKHHQYVQQTLSQIPKSNLYWLTNQKNNQKQSSSTKFITSQPALKWAWWLFLLGLLFFIIFNSKRKQRIVPIIQKLPNTTVEFVKTIGNLYFIEGDHDNLIDKKIIYFLEKIRTVYLLDTTKLNEEFVKKLQLKSGKNKFDIENVVYLINTHRKSKNKSIETDLIQLNKAIEKII